MIALVPGHFYRSAADEAWCCYVAQDGGRFGVVRLRDGRISTVDRTGKGDNLLLLSSMFLETSPCECGS